MNSAEAFAGFVCQACDRGVTADTLVGRCPDCGGPLRGDYDLSRVEPKTFTGEVSARSMWEYEALLPGEASPAISLSEGGTPIVACPSVAADCGVEEVLLKDEGRNPTGSLRDREFSVAVTAAAAHGTDCLAVPTTGAGGHSATAYAARAGLDAEIFVPSRAPFGTKAMVNVHGGEMTVVEGRYPDAEDAYEATLEPAWLGLAPFASPYRVAGAKPILYEFVAATESVPDAIVVPTGQGTTIVGLAMAARELRELGVLGSVPALYAAQPEGCAPIVRALEHGDPTPEAVEAPDTICGALEVPDPAGGDEVLDAIRDTDGGAIAVSDDELLEAAVAIAATAGIEASVSCGVAAAGVTQLRARGSLSETARVGIINPGLGSIDADVLRSHLMRHGI